MSQISSKTLIDLEFHSILSYASTFCISELGKNFLLETKPFSTEEKLLEELHQVNEYHSSFINDNKLPSHYFDDIDKEIHLLKIENSYLEPASFLKISNNTNTVHNIITFLKKFKELYPTLHNDSLKITVEKSIINEINAIITPYGEVQDKASQLLKSIRSSISSIRGKIGESFNKSLNKYNSLGYLDDIKESVIDHQRVLAVMAMHRKKVKGSFLGSSKTGSIVYIAPQETSRYNQEYQNLLYEEKQEIIRILKDLTDTIRIFFPILKEHQSYLVNIDIISAKAKYANKINGCLPTITKERKLFFRDAYHPILWLENYKKNIPTVPQTIELTQQQQIIVISGPNAGGKSITLKTIGLLQLMLQSGFLIPVHERSTTCLFDHILTDIGDNQSIENQLSTYSYRLKNMRYFLKKCNEKTLFLIDEFGTGSDPELGGALAEIFLEEFYAKKAFGIITTHYTNLKVLANELEFATNANMQFNERNLQPLFKLLVGQAGSSFTFEVAQKNGIPFSLINKAKKRVEKEKVRLDKTISTLQKERSKLQKTTEKLEAEKSKIELTNENLSITKDKIQEKLEQYQELYDNNQKMLLYGRKINELFNTFFQTNNKKKFTLELTKWLNTEKTKYVKKNPKPPTKKEKAILESTKKNEKEKIEKIEKEVLTEVKKVREKKKIELEKEKKLQENYTFKIGDKIKIKDSNTTGTIEKIEKKSVVINYGNFTTKTNLSKLVLVESGKK